MKLASADVKQLEKYLLDEIALCDEYLKTIKQEQDAVVKLDSPAVTSWGEKRSLLLEKMARLRDDRAILVGRVTGDDTTRVSEMVSTGCGPTDRKRLLALTDKVKVRLAMVEKQTREFTHILNFSLGLVNGEISLLWSATQPVTRGYNAFGSMTEGVQPGPVRSSSSLGKA